MASNQDILAFLKSEKEAREKEKVQEAEIRAKEREQDMSKIAEMIREGVREEVKAAVQPVEKRLTVQEETCQDLGRQIQNLVIELGNLKEEVQTIKDFPTLSSSVTPAGRSIASKSASEHTKAALEVFNNAGPTEGNGSDNSDVENKVLEICSKARRIVGFQPIEPRMLEIQKVAYGAKDMDEAMLMEIKSYLKCEMKVRPHDIENLEIVRIFPPAKDDWNTLYVEFGSEHEVNQIFRHTRVMVKQDHKVVRWYPKELFARFQALDSICYKMREEMRQKGQKLRTKVVVGKDDLELSTKLPTGRWKVHALPGGLPGIDLEARNRWSLSSSPPPGRPCRIEDDRKRQLSGSDSEDLVRKSKQSKQDDMQPEQEMLQNNLSGESSKQGDNVGHKQSNQTRHKIFDLVVENQKDPGNFVDQEGYSPATPAKIKNIYPVNQPSPIISSKSKNIQH